MIPKDRREIPALMKQGRPKVTFLELEFYYREMISHHSPATTRNPLRAATGMARRRKC